MMLRFVFLLTLFSQHVECYSVNGDNPQVYKEAIEALKTRTLVEPRPEPTSVLDITTAPAFPQPRTTKEKLQGPPNYWFHSNIHSLGNTGIFGAFHAAIAPLATKLIDTSAYDGENLRHKIALDLSRVVTKDKPKIADLCCGVGMSTRALYRAFDDAQSLVGIDTSPEMIAMARVLSRDNLASRLLNDVHTGNTSARYAVANAQETNLATGQFDLVTIMYAFHECPLLGRYRILREARRLLNNGGTLAVVDLSPSYQPSPAMLAGEPYVLEYKENIMRQMKSIQGFEQFRYKEMVEGHAAVWLLTRK